MSRPAFLLISAIGSFGFGALMFFSPANASRLLGISEFVQTASGLRGMGGLIIDFGTINPHLYGEEVHGGNHFNG
jgi:hypothetical protein